MALIPAMSKVNDYQFLLFLFGAPRVCLYMEIKPYKNTTRIRIKSHQSKDLKTILNYLPGDVFDLNIDQ